MFDGGCECGAVRYRMLAEPIFVNCCHCRDCQKVTGSAFAINALIEDEQIDVASGVDALATDNGASRCIECKTLLWAEHPDFGQRVKFLRVGTLDEAERISPDAHFFVRSKHPWVNVPDGIPAFETLPSESDPPLLDCGSAARLEAARG